MRKVSILWMLAAVLPTVLQTPSARAAGPDCIEQFERGRNANIACEFPTRLTPQEQADLKRITRDMLQDARCVVSINIARDALETALSTADHVFTPEPQPVRCEISTRDSTIEITGAFSPRIVVVGGRVTDATPGLADVKGVSPVLAWPVIQYINCSSTIRDGMLTVLNGYREHRARRSATAAPRS